MRSLLERGSAREKLDAFVIEGIKLYGEAPKERLLEVYVSASFHASYPEIEAEVVSDPVFERLSDVKTPQGILAVAKRSFADPAELMKSRLLIVLEGIQDPGNLGTILRTGEGAGVGGIIMDAETADPFSPKTVRSSMGSIFRVPFCRLKETLSLAERLKSAGYTLYAADARSEKSVSFEKLPFTEKSAVFIGNEAKGLKKETLEKADVRVHIPMKGQLESLNAAVAAALIMYKASADLTDLKESVE
ncbi:MAG: RNA methyltransferase [Lachnospiraceae bacterium]|nr:RNA methyltransferase [Lachnospiraceae bacterium]